MSLNPSKAFCPAATFFVIFCDADKEELTSAIAVPLIPATWYGCPDLPSKPTKLVSNKESTAAFKPGITVPVFPRFPVAFAIFPAVLPAL